MINYIELFEDIKKRRRNAAISAVYEQNMVLAEVARKLGVTRATVSLWCKKYATENGLPSISDLKRQKQKDKKKEQTAKPPRKKMSQTEFERTVQGTTFTDRTKKIAYEVLVSGRPQKELVKEYGLTRSTVCSIITRVYIEYTTKISNSI
jgi:DNA-directed RNA polymerase specialized sigma subunit